MMHDITFISSALNTSKALECGVQTLVVVSDQTRSGSWVLIIILIVCPWYFKSIKNRWDHKFVNKHINNTNISDQIHASFDDLPSDYDF